MSVSFPHTLALMTEAFGGRGGIAQFNRDFLRALDVAPQTGRIDVLPRLGQAPVPKDLTGLVQHAPSAGRIAYAARAAALALRRKPDLVINGHLYHGPLAVQVARLRGAKMISILHGTEIWKPVAPRHLAPLNASDLVICVSEDTKARYLAQAGPDAARTEVLYNTFEPRFCPGDRDAARASFGLGTEKVILTVGRLDTRGGYKGHDKILPVVAKLRTEGVDVVYLIAGEGEDRPRLERLVAELEIGSAVRFLGHVPDADMPDLYRAADVFAMPSTGEGFGIVYIEAMACGTPAIGLNVGGAAEALKAPGVAVAEGEFAGALQDALTLKGTNPCVLSQSVTSTFGKATFQACVSALMQQLEGSISCQQPVS